MDHYSSAIRAAEAAYKNELEVNTLQLQRSITTLRKVALPMAFAGFFLVSIGLSAGKVSSSWAGGLLLIGAFLLVARQASFAQKLDKASSLALARIAAAQKAFVEGHGLVVAPGEWGNLRFPLLSPQDKRSLGEATFVKQGTNQAVQVRLESHPLQGYSLHHLSGERLLQY